MNKPNVRALSRRELLKLAGASAAVTMMAACARSPRRPRPAGRCTGRQRDQAGPLAAPLRRPGARRWSSSRRASRTSIPGVTIDFQSIPWSDYWGKLASGIAAGAGSAPDVFQIPMGLVEEYVAGRQPRAHQRNLVITPADIEDTLPTLDCAAWQEGRPVLRSAAGRADAVDLPPQRPLRRGGAGIVKADFVDHQDMYDQSIKLTKKANPGLTDQVGMEHQLLLRL